MKQRSVVIFLCCLTLIAGSVHAQPKDQSEREAMYHRYLEFASYVKGGTVEPHWMADGSSFWYAEGRPDNTVIWNVDPNANTRTALFDTARLRQAIAAVLGHEPPHEGLPFAEFTFEDGEKAVKFTVAGKEFILRLDTYQISRVPSVSEEERRRFVPQVIGTYSSSTYGVPDIDIMEILSPDGRWFVSVRNYNLWLRTTDDDRAVQLTTDGVRDYGWGRYWDDWAWWSPNGWKLAVRKGDYRNVPKYPIVNYLGPTDDVQWSLSDSDPFPPTELFIVDILTKKLVRIDTGGELLWVLGWRPDGSELLFLRSDPKTTKLDLMAANPSTGSTRIILTESRTTWGLWLQWKRLFTPLENGARFIWRSERDGWNHLYLYDLDGNLIRRLTEGLFPVVQVVAVDETVGWVYFTAHGDPRRPYDTHFYRVDLDGNRLARLTEANGQHDIQFAPSKEFFLDTHSNVDRPPAVELKRADGTLLQTVSKANIDALKELKWKPPEEFVVKAADGITDLHGVLYKPYDFDPNKKYPVIDRIYGSPARAFVARTFVPDFGYLLSQARGQLGFIHLIVDARGTPERGREFQEVVYGNLGRIEIPDHVAALQQLAETRPYMDLSRVGVQGHSFGGYFAIRAMLLAPNVYHVGVAGAPGAPDQEDWAGSNAVLLGNKEAYEYASNLNFAANLQGKLLLLHGTSDVCVPFLHTMKMVEALIRAGKHFDLLVLPGVGHQFRGTSSSDLTSQTYALEAIRRYFQEHLKP